MPALVTEVRIQLTREPPILAFVAVTLWDTFVVHDLRILQRRDGSLVVLMPRLKGPDGEWATVAHPLNEETRRTIEDCVMQAFASETQKAAAQASA